MRSVLDFDWLKRLLDPFGELPVARPPDRPLAFYRHFVAPVRGLILIVMVISLLGAITEMALFVFLGWIVDRATVTPRALFFGEYWPMLAGMGAVILLLRPLNAILSRTFSNLGLMPQLTFSVRWQSYRYVLRQSLAFFQNDFAGRIAQKVLQTGPALRDTVSGIIDGIWTLLIYVGGTIYLFVGLDARLIVPIALWTVAYAATIVFLVPPVRSRSAAVSEANSLLSGRIVDGYSNIQSVKLFAHAEREDAFALEGFQRHLEAYRALQPDDRQSRHPADGHQQHAHIRGRRLGVVALVRGGDHRRRHCPGDLAGDPPQSDVRLDPAPDHVAVRERRHRAERDADDQPALRHCRIEGRAGPAA